MKMDSCVVVLRGRLAWMVISKFHAAGMVCICVSVHALSVQWVQYAKQRRVGAKSHEFHHLRHRRRCHLSFW